MANNEELGDEREPVLEGFAPDYDLRLFREAQALAAVKIEEELGDISTDKGTRSVATDICTNDLLSLLSLSNY